MEDILQSLDGLFPGSSPLDDGVMHLRSMRLERNLDMIQAGFNQLLRGQTECGLMRTSLSEIDMDGPDGAPASTIRPSSM